MFLLLRLAFLSILLEPVCVNLMANPGWKHHMEIHLTDKYRVSASDAHLFLLLLLRQLNRDLDLFLLFLFQEQGGGRLGNVFQKVQRQQVTLMQRKRQENLPQ